MVKKPASMHLASKQCAELGEMIARPTRVQQHGVVALSAPPEALARGVAAARASRLSAAFGV